MKVGVWLLAAALLASCQPQSSSATPSPSNSLRPSPTPTTPIAAGQILGAPGCKPPSPATPWQGPSGPPELRGTASGGELWALLDGGQFPEPKGLQLKIIWRMTGAGELHISASGPAGRIVQPDWGPQAHGGSNWERPGDEWGVGFTFPVAGCWDVHAVRDDTSGDVYIMAA